MPPKKKKPVTELAEVVAKHTSTACSVEFPASSTARAVNDSTESAVASGRIIGKRPTIIWLP